MAHFAELDTENKVIRVVVGNNDDPNEGYDWLIQNLGGRWMKTSYNTHGGVHTGGETPFRKNYAGIGYSYDESRDAFIPPQPYPSWILNEDTCQWESPVPHPDGLEWIWNEETETWEPL